MKLNLGCGIDKKEGFVNVDYHNDFNPDVVADLNGTLPFPKECAEYVEASHVLEHLNNPTDFLMECHRVLKGGGVLKILTPHYTGTYAFKYLFHKHWFGIGTLDLACSNRKVDIDVQTPKKFWLKKEELHLFMQNKLRHPILYYTGFVNVVFNLGRAYQKIMERVWVFGFEEVTYELVKEER